MFGGKRHARFSSEREPSLPRSDTGLRAAYNGSHVADDKHGLRNAWLYQAIDVHRGARHALCDQTDRSDDDQARRRANCEIKQLNLYDQLRVRQLGLELADNDFRPSRQVQ